VRERGDQVIDDKAAMCADRSQYSLDSVSQSPTSGSQLQLPVSLPLFQANILFAAIRFVAQRNGCAPVLLFLVVQ
jgi:hypothetical protein